MSLKNIIEYKGYLAELILDIEDDIIVGRVINTTDNISFHGETVEDAKLAYHDVLDTYLSTCHEEGIEPSLPCSGRFSLRVNPILHQNLRHYAKLRHQSLNDFIVGLLEQDLENLVHR
jgi:predicted HicB family RNase H-like nuclease